MLPGGDADPLGRGAEKKVASIQNTGRSTGENGFVANIHTSSLCVLYRRDQVLLATANC